MDHEQTGRLRNGNAEAWTKARGAASEQRDCAGVPALQDAYAA